MVSAHSNQTVLDVVFDGPALSDGSMNVQQLAPAMLAIGELFGTANQVLNGDSTTIHTNVRAHSEGSFEIGFLVVQNIETANILASGLGDAFSTASDITTLILGASGLFGLIKWLKGRIPHISQVDSTKHDFSVDNETRSVSVDISNLYSNPRVRIRAESTVSPLKTNGIDRVSFRENGETIQEVNEEEAESFKITSTQESLHDTITEMTFTIVGLSFRENNIWRLSDGTNTYPVRMRDEAFWRRIEGGVASFSKGDELRCNFRKRQYRTNGDIKTEYEVLEVLSHTPNRQSSFLDMVDGEP